jgi:hypothetical protein
VFEVCQVVWACVGLVCPTDNIIYQLAQTYELFTVFVGEIVEGLCEMCGVWDCGWMLQTNKE